MPLITIGTGGASKKVAWLMFRQHSWESGSSWAGDGAVRHLLSNEGAALRDAPLWKVFPMADPDGVARGGVRFNKHGYDLNRNWDLVKPDVMPEIAAQKKAIFDWLDAGNRIDFFLSIHNTESSEYLAGPPAGAGIGKAVFDALVRDTRSILRRRCARKLPRRRRDARPYVRESRAVGQAEDPGVSHGAARRV